MPITVYRIQNWVGPGYIDVRSKHLQLVYLATEFILYTQANRGEQIQKLGRGGQLKKSENLLLLVQNKFWGPFVAPSVNSSKYLNTKNERFPKQIFINIDN